MGLCLKAEDDLFRGMLTVGNRRAIPRWKRVLDLSLVALVSPLVLVLSVVIAVSIKLASRGPVFFRQERIGYGGQPFILLKFRTMKADADSGTHAKHLEGLISSGAPLTKIDDLGDARLIPLGWVWRVTGLDELGQVINIVRGEMSWVGPRPCMGYEIERMTPHQRRRFAVLPGITGLWQTNGKNLTTFQEMLRFDVAYAYEMSLWLDLKIMVGTVPVIWEQICRALARGRTRKQDPRMEFTESAKS